MRNSLTLAALTIAGLAGTSAQASELFGAQFSGVTDLYTINQATGFVSSIGNTTQDNLGDMTSDTRPGSPTLWGLRIASNELFELDPLTGLATSVASLNSPNNMVSIAFDAVSGKLFGNTSVGFGAPFDALYEIDPGTGNSTFIGRILFDNVFALGFDQSGILFGVSDNLNQLISIDTTTGNGAHIADLAVGFSFDIASRPEDNVMFLADSGTASLYTVDTGSGALGFVGSYGSNLNIAGLAFLPTPIIPEASTVIAGVMMGGLVIGAAARRRLTASR